MFRDSSPLPSLALALALLLGGCLVTTDEDAWKDGAPQGDMQRMEATVGEQGPRPDGPDHDGPRPDAPEPDVRPWDGPVPDKSVQPDQKKPDQQVVDQQIPPDLPPGSEGKLPLGTTCGSGGQCQSGHCVDSVCCDTLCSGPCVACDLTGSLGTCKAVPTGTDPDNDCAQDPVATCGLDGTCNGSGGCRNYPAGTVCSATCTATDVSTVKKCDGSGTCQAGVNTDCSPYACDASQGTCYTSCSSDAECIQYRCNTATSKCYSTCSSVTQCQPSFKCNPQGKCV